MVSIITVAVIVLYVRLVLHARTPAEGHRITRLLYLVMLVFIIALLVTVTFQ